MSRLRSQFPSLYRFAAWLALLAMLVPVLTGILHHPAKMNLVGNAAGSAAGNEAGNAAWQDSMRLCGMIAAHAQGVGASQTAPYSKPDPKQDQAPFCPICQSLHLLGGGYVPPDDVTIAVLPVVVAVFLAEALDSPSRFRFEPQAQPRAPPIFASV